MKKKGLLKRRPAESASLSGAVLAGALIQAFELPAKYAALITIGCGLLAPLVTAAVDRWGSGKQVETAIE